MKLILLSAFCAILASCQVLKVIADNPEAIAPAVSYAASLVLNKAVDPADLVDKKAKLASLADKIAKIPVDKKLTETELRALIEDKIPGVGYWKKLEDKVVSIYLKETAKVKDEDVANVLAVLKEIGVGLKNASK
jgi:hypothetical protein